MNFLKLGPLIHKILLFKLSADYFEIFMMDFLWIGYDLIDSIQLLDKKITDRAS